MAEAVFDPADGFAPDRLAEPDRKFLHDQPAPLGGQKMSELMDDDEQVENQDDLYADEEELENVENHKEC